VLVTVIVVACTGIATAQSSSTPIAHAVDRIIATVHITLSLPGEEQKKAEYRAA
jgi:hypothetical protein